MKYKTLLQSFGTSFYRSFYIKYFSQSNSLMTTKKMSQMIMNLIHLVNTVKNISYESNDDNGNNYIIKLSCNLILIKKMRYS